MKHEKDLDKEFTERHEFQTNVRGVKVRRVFANLEEAQMYSKVLQRKFPRDNLYLGKVGCWLPWDPSEHVMPEVEYAEKELNEMMRKYKENEVNKDIFFDERKNEKIEDQKKENEKRRKEMEQQKSLMDQPPVHPSEGAIRE
jgi:Skp family chaperone for outer membrane proteins